MELAGTGGTDMPKIFSMDMSTDFVPMAVLSESSQGKTSVEGKIYHKFDMKPHEEFMTDYRKLCSDMNKKSMTRTRQIQVIENDNGMRMRPMPGTFDMIKSSGPMEKRVQAKGSETKRTRRDPDQPEQFLKDMLKLLCVYNNKGANQGSYELKPEYRRSDDRSDIQ